MIRRIRWACAGLVLAMGCPSEPGPQPPPERVERCQPGGPAPGRRLTATEYRDTLHDLLGVDLADQPMPEDPRADGFSNTADALVVSLEHIQTYAELAERAAERVDPQTLGMNASALGALLFSRPLTDDERAALALAEAQQVHLQALLQSPPFLYRLEPQGPDGAALTSRLSFLVFGARPTGEAQPYISDPQTRAALVRSWLEDPRARRAAQRYLVDWLDLDALDDMTRDPARYPNFDPALAAQMKQEAIDLFDRLIEEKRPLLELFSAQRTKLPRRLAELYGFEPQGETAMYSLAERPERQGLLTQPGVLAVSGESDEASMVKRGLYILENILCGQVEAPPAGLDTTPPMPAVGQTQRTASTERLESPACTGCHTQIDPLAYALEPFDGIGSFSFTDRFENTLRSDGDLTLDDQRSTFMEASAFMTLLAQSPTVERCLVQKQLQHTLGRPLTSQDDCMTDRILTRFVEGGGTYTALIVAIAEDEGFAAPATEGP